MRWLWPWRQNDTRARGCFKGCEYLAGPNVLNGGNLVTPLEKGPDCPYIRVLPATEKAAPLLSSGCFSYTSIDACVVPQ